MSRRRKIKVEDLPEVCKEIDRQMYVNGVRCWETLGYSTTINTNGRWSTSPTFITNQGSKLRINCEHTYSYRHSDSIIEYHLSLGVMINNEKYYKNIIVETTCPTFDGFEVTVTGVCYNMENYGWYTDDVMHFDVLWANHEKTLTSLRSTNSYLYDYCNQAEHSTYAPVILSFPTLEILDKAGFRIVQEIYTSSFKTSEKDMFLRTFKSGSSPKEIIQMPKRYYNLLKDVTDISVWDNIRKLVKNTDVGTDAIRLVLHDNAFLRNINSVYAILKAKWDNKPVFTVEKLVSYLKRIDTYEAIDTDEGLILIKDYLQMCQILHIKPVIDGDSLKREHDVCARLVREKRNEELAEKMQSKCDELQKYNYSEDIFMIRGIKDYDDLIDEAKQQHNCVASYAKSIASGDSCIYVMREAKYPDKSLITIELSPDGRTIRQKLLACNKHIRNKAQTEFIERWHKHVLQCV